MRSRLAAGVVAVALCLNSGLKAQDTFEEASVKRRLSTQNVVPAVFLPNGQWSAQSATLVMILRSAFGLDRFVGLPRWAATERFDIVTTPSPNTPTAQLQAMARALLAERFELRTRIEQRTSELFVIVRAKEDGFGPGLRSSTTSCPHGAAPTSSADDSTRSKQCAELIAQPERDVWRFQLRDRPLRDLLIISSARIEVGDPIVDRATGPVDRFDIDFEFASRTPQERAQDGLGLPYDVAFEKQLGLRFERRQELIDVLVIEHVALPTAD